MKAKEIIETVYNDTSKSLGLQATLANEMGLHGYKFLGRQAYAGNCEAIKLCQELGHQSSSIVHNERGSDATYWCDECKIFWKIDMSD